MSDFQRSLCRNLVIGLLASFLCYMCYYPILSNLPEANSLYSYALLASSCTTIFCLGFATYTNDHDPPLFKYLVHGARLALPLTTMSAFMGLLLFQWWGLGIGFVAGIWSSILIVRLCGPEKPVDPSCQEKNFLYSMVDYYSRRMRIPSAVIPPLAVLGVFLFQWWGLGAGIVIGGLISSVSLGLWGQTKPQPELSPTPSTPSTPVVSAPSSHHRSESSSAHRGPVMPPTASVMPPPAPVMPPTAPGPPSTGVLYFSTEPVTIPRVDKAALFEKLAKSF